MSSPRRSISRTNTTTICPSSSELRSRPREPEQRVWIRESSNPTDTSDHAWGSPYARATGAGLANEIIARLTGTPVTLGSGTNSTLDLNSATFPYNKSFYADFSHDNNLVTLLPTLGLEWESDLPSQPKADAVPAHK